jgi:hypothetical protein
MKAMPQRIVIDLWHDFAELCRSDLAARGHHLAGYTDENVVRLFLNADRLSVASRPRSVLYSTDFACPSEHQQALSVIEGKIKAGKDINPHRSTRNRDIGNLDELLNHWGIYHLHLGADIEEAGYSKRTGDLLFCRFSTDAAFLIGVYPHGVWSRQELIQIVHDNWPKSIAQWQANGLTSDGLTEEQIKTLRKRNVNHTLEMSDGTIYLPPGGGVTAAGSNPLDIYRTDCLKDWARKQEQRIVDDWDNIVERAKTQGVLFAEPPELRLEIRGETFCAVETRSYYTLPLLEPETHCG